MKDAPKPKHRIVVLAIPQDGRIGVGNIIPGPAQKLGRGFHLTQHPAEESMDTMRELGYPDKYISAIKIYECELTFVRELPPLNPEP